MDPGSGCSPRGCVASFEESIEILFMRQPPAGGLRRSTTHHCVTLRKSARRSLWERKTGFNGAAPRTCSTPGIWRLHVRPAWRFGPSIRRGFPSGPARSQQTLRHRKGAARTLYRPGVKFLLPSSGASTPGTLLSPFRRARAESRNRWSSRGDRGLGALTCQSLQCARPRRAVAPPHARAARSAQSR